MFTWHNSVYKTIFVWSMFQTKLNYYVKSMLVKVRRMLFDYLERRYRTRSRGWLRCRVHLGWSRTLLFFQIGWIKRQRIPWTFGQWFHSPSPPLFAELEEGPNGRVSPEKWRTRCAHQYCNPGGKLHVVTILLTVALIYHTGALNIKSNILLMSLASTCGWILAASKAFSSLW